MGHRDMGMRNAKKHRIQRKGVRRSCASVVLRELWGFWEGAGQLSVMGGSSSVLSSSKNSSTVSSAFWAVSARGVKPS